MRKILTAVAAIALAFGFTSISAMAQSGSIGCGGGNGASTPCNGQSLGTVTANSNGSVSGSTDVAITGVSGLPSSVSGLQVFTPNTDQFDFSFANVNLTFGQGGTFTFTDLSEPGLLTVSGEAEYGSTPPLPSLIGSLDIVLEATSFTFNGNSGTLNNVMGNADLTLDPGNVMSMTGTVGLPSVGGTGGTGGGPSPAPEPSTLLLLGSGLVALGFMARKFGCA